MSSKMIRMLVEGALSSPLILSPVLTCAMRLLTWRPPRRLLSRWMISQKST